MSDCDQSVEDWTSTNIVTTPATVAAAGYRYLYRCEFGESLQSLLAEGSKIAGRTKTMVIKDGGNDRRALRSVLQQRTRAHARSPLNYFLMIPNFIGSQQAS